MNVGDPKRVTPERVAAHAFAIAERHGIDLTQVVVYGSIATSTNTTESDVDVVLVSPDFMGVDYYARGHHFQWEWDRERYGTPDIIPVTPGEFHERAEDPTDIVSEALDTGERFSTSPTSSA
jgi:predicted nucleotidyltransferase